MLTELCLILLLPGVLFSFVTAMQIAGRPFKRWSWATFAWGLPFPSGP